MVLVFVFFTLKRPKYVVDALISLIICMLHFTYVIELSIVVLVNTWEFDTPYSFAVITWVVLFWILLPSCPHSIQLRYWQKYSGSSMKFYGSLWWTVLIYEFIVGDGKV